MNDPKMTPQKAVEMFQSRIRLAETQYPGLLDDYIAAMKLAITAIRELWLDYDGREEEYDE